MSKAEERDIGDIVEDNLKTSGQCGEAACCANTIKVHITCAFAAPYYVFDKGVLNEVQKRLSKWCQQTASCANTILIHMTHAFHCTMVHLGQEGTGKSPEKVVKWREGTGRLHL